MKLFALLQEYFFGYNSFFYFRNIIEILFFSTMIYYFSIWLKKDRHKNLLPYFYGYCLLALSSYYAQLTTANYFLFLFAPVAIMLFMLFHQELLQRNFVAIKNITPAKQAQSDWPEALIRSFLVAINNNKEIHCIIENQDSMQEFIHSPLVLNSNIQQGLIKILQESDIFDQNKMLWVDTSGHLVGINASWKETVFETIEDEKMMEVNPWKQSALLLSSKTDALFLRITPAQRTFDIVFNGKIVNNINSNTALKVIRKYASTKFWTSNSWIEKGDLINETYSQKDIFKQRTN